MNKTHTEGGRVVAICGGIGGAKLALGLSRQLGDQLTVIVNTGDDFEHLGLSVSPDLDTVLYTLGGRADSERGWGRAGETWAFMSAIAEVGGETWFALGDRDLAIHVERTRRLRAGESLSSIARDFAKRYGIQAEILPMSDDPVRTIVVTQDGELPFQRYFVERRCEPRVAMVRFAGVETAQPAPGVAAALSRRDLRAVVICPSNPYLSIDPVLAVPHLRDLIAGASGSVVAVSPIIGGKAVKGPTTKIMSELGRPLTSESIVRHYEGLISGIVIDTTDREDVAKLKVPCLVTETLMSSLSDRERLAEQVLAFADRCRGGSIGSPKRPQ